MNLEQRVMMQRELGRKMRERILEKGYADIAAFVRGSGLEKHVSFETTRRAVNEASRPVTAATNAAVMKFLDYNEEEILQVVRDSGDNVLLLLMGDVGINPLTIEQQGLLGAIERLQGMREDVMTDIAGLLRVVSECIGVDISADLSKMTRKKRARKTGTLSTIMSAVEIEPVRKLQVGV
jgi:hypothetical protein